jgi:seryl-tRNA synthetase
MIDLKLLREEPDRVRKAVARKKFAVDFDAIFAADAKRRAAVAEAENARAGQKAANNDMAKLPKGSPEFQAKVAEMKLLSAKVKELEAVAKTVDEEWEKIFLTLPNLPHDSVPDGRADIDNVVTSTWGDPAKASPHAKPHFDIPWFSQLVDFERGVKVTGAGFPFYVGDMSRLVRALVSFFLEEARLAGYEEVWAPLMVNPASATATGQLPDKEGQMYHATVDDFYLIPTAEVPVTNFFRDEIINEKDLPLYRCGYTPCFRREAGSWGAHVRGLNRLHQFDKVELVKWVKPESSFAELDKLRADAERLLQKLGLPYRVLLICSGDIGFPHAKQYDLEVWAAGQKRWLEVSSCSNFTDFQARRAGIRYRPADGGKAEVVHTLNGSGLAVPRVLAAILENNLEADGRVRVPEVLHRWYGGGYIGKNATA